MQESSPDGNKVSFLWCPARTLGLVIAIQFCMMCAFCLPRAKIKYPIRLFYKIAHTNLQKLFPSPKCSGDNLVKQCAYVSKKMPSLNLCPGKAASMLLPKTNEDWAGPLCGARNCCASPSSVKYAWIALARWANSNCS